MEGLICFYSVLNLTVFIIAFIQLCEKMNKELKTIRLYKILFPCYYLALLLFCKLELK